MKGTLASPAVALANRVLPVPGGPVEKKNTVRFKGGMIERQKQEKLIMAIMEFLDGFPFWRR